MISIRFPIHIYYNLRVRGQEKNENKLWRLLPYSVTNLATDFIFGIQGSIMRVVKPLEFQKPQRSGDRFDL